MFISISTEVRPALNGRRKAAFTLIEVMIAASLGLIALAVVGSLSWYSSRSFAAVANYVDLDQSSQLALDKMSREIRQARQLVSYTPTSLTFLDVDSNPLHFIYDPETRTLVRVSGGQTNTLLRGCDSLQFSKYQHTAISNTFDAYDPAFVTNSKLIQVSWMCSRTILGAKVNTESVQSAKIALRNN
jgi:type II secretory pathway pseudopilin PulG